jgi:hypothetical protein
VNLGQLIDPEWAQQRFPDRSLARRHERLAGPLTITTHIDGITKLDYQVHRRAEPIQPDALFARPRPRAAVPASAAPTTAAKTAATHITRMRQALRPAPKGNEFLRLLVGQEGGLAAGAIAKRAGAEVSSCCAHLRRLLRLSCVKRTGKRRYYLYKITPAGLARVKLQHPEG